MNCYTKETTPPHYCLFPSTTPLSHITPFSPILALSSNAQRTVEGISSSLSALSISRRLTIGTRIKRILRRITLVRQLLADESRNHVDVVCGTVVEVVLVRSGERIRATTVVLRGKLDGRVTAGAEVEGLTTDLLGGSGVACGFCCEVLA